MRVPKTESWGTPVVTYSMKALMSAASAVQIEYDPLDKIETKQGSAHDSTRLQSVQQNIVRDQMLSAY